MDPQFKREREREEEREMEKERERERESKTNFNLSPPLQSSESRLYPLFKFCLLLNKQLSNIYLLMHISKCDTYYVTPRKVWVITGAKDIRGKEKKSRTNAYDRKSIFSFD